MITNHCASCRHWQDGSAYSIPSWCSRHEVFREFDNSCPEHARISTETAQDRSNWWGADNEAGGSEELVRGQI